jgi:hypothetical protein
VRSKGQDTQKAAIAVPEKEGAATAATRATILRLLQEGEVHPQLIILVVARVAGRANARDQ